ncbi:hypothetical protein niasHS_006038 [Heterodera schachtii]|uniref:Uncharacterized protein n=1 Tax=Heterodera schachtii TaxID=97005 RepID=A0ABD2JVX9_HETSC
MTVLTGRASAIIVLLEILHIATAPDKKCGLPANLNQLPDFAQDEIRSIWRDYVPGNRCEKEQTITEDILTVLAMFDKELESHGTGNKSGTKHLAKLLPEATTVRDETLPRIRLASLDAHSIPSGPLRSLFVNDSLTNDHEASSVQESPTKDDLGAQISFSDDKPQRLRKFPSLHSVDYDYEYLEEAKIPGKFRSNIDDVQNDQKHKIAKDYEASNIEEGHQQTQGKAKDAGGQIEFVKRLPFLQESSPEVVEVFMEVMDDADIPSEGRRMEELHLLAVSYLNARQLDEFNRWSTIRRKRIQSRERQLHNLSPRARAALRQLTQAADMDQARVQLRHIEPALRDELHSWGQSRERAEH